MSLGGTKILKVYIGISSKWEKKNVRSVPRGAAKQTRGGKGKNNSSYFFSLVAITAMSATTLTLIPADSSFVAVMLTL